MSGHTENVPEFELPERGRMLVKWKRTRTNTIVCKVVLSADSAGRELGD